MGQNISEEKKPKDILSCLAEVGKDSNPTLNDCESKCLNYKFQDRRGDFDFSGKKVAFFRGNTGRIWVSKEWHFEQVKISVNVYGYIPFENMGVQLVFFDQEDVEYIGYDVAIFVASKKYISKEKAFKRLSK